MLAQDEHPLSDAHDELTKGRESAEFTETVPKRDGLEVPSELRGRMLVNKTNPPIRFGVRQPRVGRRAFWENRREDCLEGCHLFYQKLHSALSTQCDIVTF